MDQPRKLHTTATLVAVAIIAAALGFVAGFLLAKKIYQPEAGHIPCPPCKVVVNTAVSPTECRLVGRIDDNWMGGPVSVSAPTVVYGSNDLKSSYGPGDCLDIKMASCPEAGTNVSFTKVNNVSVENPLCHGPSCPAIAGCE
jgi:hypothetical protein